MLLDNTNDKYTIKVEWDGGKAGKIQFQPWLCQGIVVMILSTCVYWVAAMC